MDVDFANKAKKEREENINGMGMTIEERRARKREYYAQNREKICEKQRNRYKKLGKRAKKRLLEQKRKWYAESEKAQVYKERKKRQHKTEEYRAKRRAAYAAKHANDPMTEHRRACIEAQQKRMEKPLADRKAEIMAAKAEKAAKKDMQDEGYLQTEEKSERKRETVIKFIECWAHIRKGFRLSSLMIPDPDKAYYRREAEKYVSMRDQYGTADISERNIISIKMRKIEAKFKALYHDKYLNKNKNEYEEYENY